MTSLLPIINYHGIEAREGEFPWTPGERSYVLSKKTFQIQLEQLRSLGFNALSLTQLGEWLSGGRANRKNVLLTFDDGHLSHFLHAAPILAEKKMKAVFFVSAGLIGQKDQMDWGHLRELVRDGFEIGSHGLRHIPLTGLSETELDQELGASRQKLEDGLGVPVTSFSVPRGFFKPRISQVAEECGYRFVFTSQFDVNRMDKRGLSSFCLKRLAMKRTLSLESFTALIHGNLGFCRYTERLKSAARRILAPSFYSSLANWKNRFEIGSTQ